ncbi:hypothetical protein HCX48_09880 [Rhodocyclus tenuis]|uniref:Uncharacterized protein n=1 Tax=Rhodocyclus gracilis TaxID=2929842 RepID=A0ABX0WII2_9RHOO|nr:hypothetical protein [Rhodocyclus gracilis]NJA89530.1 hypothetical protein [Rhodocyclus gracilis]
MDKSPINHTQDTVWHGRFRAPRRPARDTQDVRWQDDLPPAYKDLVIVPLRFEILHEYEILANRTNGYDENEQACYCAYRFVLTSLRSDDDEMFYEEPTYAETTVAWRMRDERWLIYRQIVGNYALGVAHRFYSLSNTMPR